MVEPHEAEFAALQAHFPVYEGTRAIMVVEVTRISDSCGYGVPLLKYEGERRHCRPGAANAGQKA